MKFHIPTNRANKLNQFIQNEDWLAVKHRCENRPKEAAVWSKRVGFFGGDIDSRVLPLHQACAIRAPKDVINALIIAYSKGVEAKESTFNRLPLHLACQFSCNVEVIKLLLSCDQLGAETEDSLGRFPIHYACSNGASPDVLDAFLSHDPSTAKFADKNGWLPIHVACHMGASTEAIRKLLEADPDSAGAKTTKGSTPLKLVSKINCKNKDEIISLLENASSSGKQSTCSSNTELGANIVERRVATHAA